MTKFDYLLKDLQALNIIQDKYWDECIPSEIWVKYDMSNIDGFLIHHIDITHHKRYDTGLYVGKIHGRFLAVRHVIRRHNAQLSYLDCNHTLTFSEVKREERVVWVEV